MESLVLLDSSVLCEWMKIPGHCSASKHADVAKTMKSLLEDGATFFIPIAAVVEVGNHVANIKDGTVRRKSADKFTGLLRKCLEEERPFATIPLWDRGDLKRYVDSFVANATVGIGMGDISIIREFEKLCEANPTAQEVWIWTTDGHLDSYRKVITRSLRR